MLKTTRSPNKPALSSNDGSRSVFATNDGNDEIDELGGNSEEHTKKSGKSKGKKLAKS